MRPIGTAEELERRRRRAVKLVEEGESPKTIARILGVALGSVYRWCNMAQENPDGLKSKAHPGRSRSLSEEQHKQLEALLKQGPEEHGWSAGCRYRRNQASRKKKVSGRSHILEPEEEWFVIPAGDPVRYRRRRRFRHLAFPTIRANVRERRCSPAQ